jgi:predicted dipeptidase
VDRMKLAAVMFLAATLSANVGKVEKRYDAVESKQLVPMLAEVIRFATYAGNDEAHAEQKAWLMKTATTLGFVARDAGKITEIELPATKGKTPPVLGLVVHGDVQPVDLEAWSFHPFEGKYDEQFAYGRGAADDKGPLVQALLAMKSLKESGIARTHTIRLLVGSEEESSATEMAEYLKTHAAPDYSLVLDSEFPVVVGEKAWNALSVMTPLNERGVARPYRVADLTAGLGPSIVPDRAEIVLEWIDGPAKWDQLIAKLKEVPMPEGTRLATDGESGKVRIVAYGKSSHAGVNPKGGRNALVALARVLDGLLPQGGANDLLAFARTAGKDLIGTGLDITDSDPIWGNYTVNVATIKMLENEPASRALTINLRSIPPRTGQQLKAHLEAFVTAFNERTGASLQPYATSSYWDDSVLGFDPNAKLVKRLLASYTRATGQKVKPAISGGGTYAKRLPNAIAFGMWFPGKPYPGHDVDEKIPVADLQRGTHVLIDALVDIATGPKIEGAFKK